MQVLTKSVSGLLAGLAGGLLVNGGAPQQDKNSDRSRSLPGDHQHLTTAVESAHATAESRKSYPHIPKRNLAMLRNLGLSEDELAVCDTLIAGDADSAPCTTFREKAIELGFDGEAQDTVMWNLLAASMGGTIGRASLRDFAKTLKRENISESRMIDCALASANPEAFLEQGMENQSEQDRWAVRLGTEACAVACHARPDLLWKFKELFPGEEQQLWDSISRQCNWMTANDFLRMRSQFASQVGEVEFRLGMSDATRLADEFAAAGFSVLGEGKQAADLPSPIIAALFARELAQGAVSLHDLEDLSYQGRTALDRALGIRGDAQYVMGEALLELSPAALTDWDERRQYLAGGAIAAAVRQGEALPDQLVAMPEKVRAGLATELAVDGWDADLLLPLLANIGQPDAVLESISTTRLAHETVWELQESLGGSDELRADIVRRWFEDDPAAALASAGADSGSTTSARLRESFGSWLRRDSWAVSIALSDITDPAILSWAGPLLADEIESEDPAAAALWREAGR